MFSQELFNQAYARKMFRQGADIEPAEDFSQLADRIKGALTSDENFKTREPIVQAELKKRKLVATVVGVIASLSFVHDMSNDGTDLINGSITAAAAIRLVMTGLQYRHTAKHHASEKELAVNDVYAVMWDSRYRYIMENIDLQKQEKNDRLYTAMQFDALTLPLWPPEGGTI